MREAMIFLSSAVLLVLSSIYAVSSVLNSNALERYYIFDPEDLHALSLKSIQQHGNNTKALVAGIVEQLRADKDLAPYLSVQEEWMFNNAGGAMGAMYIIHASKYSHFLSITCFD